jgi:hypothetical protein
MGVENLENKTYTASQVRMIASKEVKDALRQSFKNMNKNIVFWREVHFPMVLAQYGTWSEIMIKEFGINNPKDILASMYVAQKYLMEDMPVRMKDVRQFVELPKHYKPQEVLIASGFMVKYSRLVKGEMKDKYGHYILTDKARKSTKKFSKRLKVYERKLDMHKINLKSGKWKKRGFNLWLELDQIFNKERTENINALKRENQQLKEQLKQ